MPAPERNTNAVGHKSPTKGKKGIATMMSLPYKVSQPFKAAMMARLGSGLTEKDYIELWRQLDYAVIEAVRRPQTTIDTLIDQIVSAWRSEQEQEGTEQ